MSYARSPLLLALVSVLASACTSKAGPAGPAGPAGEAGPAGRDGQSVTSEPVPSGEGACAEGGSRFVSASGVTYACHGRTGAPGPQGAPGPALTLRRLDGTRYGHVVGGGVYTEQLGCVASFGTSGSVSFPTTVTTYWTGNTCSGTPYALGASSTDTASLPLHCVWGWGIDPATHSARRVPLRIAQPVRREVASIGSWWDRGCADPDPAVCCVSLGAQPLTASLFRLEPLPEAALAIPDGYTLAME